MPRDREYFKQQSELSRKAKDAVSKVSKKKILHMSDGNGQTAIISKSVLGREYLVTSRPFSGAEPKTRRVSKSQAESWAKTFLEDGLTELNYTDVSKESAATDSDSEE